MNQHDKKQNKRGRKTGRTTGSTTSASSLIKEEQLPTITRMFENLGNSVQKHPRAIVFWVLVITILMVIPLANIDTETSMDDFVPESEAVDAEETIENEFSGERSITFVVEARRGEDGTRNVLSAPALREMLLVEGRLRNNEELSRYLIEGVGVVSVADAVRMMVHLQLNKTMENASDEEIEGAVSAVVADPEISRLVSRVTTDGNRTSAKAALILVKIDNEHTRGDQEKLEDIALNIRDMIKEEDHETIKISMAFGMNHEMQEASQDTLSTLLPLSIIIIIVILYLSLRRVSDVLLSVIAVPVIFVWTFGSIGLLGLGFSQFTFTVPILVLSLGIDYAIHALHRYREEQRNGVPPDRAVKSCITHVGSALFLTTVTTVGAFLSNVVSDVPAIRDFGITVAIGIFSAFIVMGIFLPALRLVIDNFHSKHGGPITDNKRKSEKRRGKQIGSSTASQQSSKSHGSSTASQQSSKSHGSSTASQQSSKSHGSSTASQQSLKSHGSSSTSQQSSKRPVFVMAADITLKRYGVVLAVVALITLGSIVVALRLETELKPRDIVSDDSDFANALDVLEESFPGAGHEKGYILIRGNIAGISTISAIKETLINLDDDEHVGHINGKAESDSLIPYLAALVGNESIRSQLDIHDTDGNGIPDSDEELTSALDHLYANGIVIEGNVVSSGIIRSVLHRNDKGHYDMALIIVEAKDVLGFDGKYLLEELEDDARPLKNSGVKFVVTGSPVTRYEMLSAMTDGMMKSIFISITIALVFLILVFRSVKDGIITILPVVLISTWVFGTMWLLGYYLNVVTVTIAAMTIGVGVDYSIHIRQRYREELENKFSPQDAMDRAIEHSGKALLGAAGTTALGFGVLYFAEMNLFSMYGLLSALMIVYAFLVAIFVLPGLLMLGDGKMKSDIGDGRKKSDIGKETIEKRTSGKGSQEDGSQEKEARDILLDKITMTTSATGKS